MAVISVLQYFITTIEKHESLYVSELIRSILTFQRLKDKFWNFIFYKFIFIFGVMNVQNMDEVICWSAWFTILGFLHLFSQLCKDRFEYVSTCTCYHTNKRTIEHLFYSHCIEGSPPFQSQKIWWLVSVVVVKEMCQREFWNSLNIKCIDNGLFPFTDTDSNSDPESNPILELGS